MMMADDDDDRSVGRLITGAHPCPKCLIFSSSFLSFYPPLHHQKCGNINNRCSSLSISRAQECNLHPPSATLSHCVIVMMMITVMMIMVVMMMITMMMMMNGSGKKGNVGF